MIEQAPKTTEQLSVLAWLKQRSRLELCLMMLASALVAMWLQTAQESRQKSAWLDALQHQKIRVTAVDSETGLPISEFSCGLDLPLEKTRDSWFKQLMVSAASSSSVGESYIEYSYVGTARLAADVRAQADGYLPNRVSFTSSNELVTKVTIPLSRKPRETVMK